MISQKKYYIVIVLVAMGLAVTFAPALQQALDDWQIKRQLSHGRELSTVYCTACHLEPPPDILPRRSWEIVLGYMGYMMGMDNIDYLAHHPEFAQENVRSKQRFLTTENMIPDTALLSENDWETLRNYYIESATEEALPQVNKPPLNWELPQFDIVQSDYHTDPAVTTMIHVRQETSQAYIGDSAAHSIAILDADGQLDSETLQFGRAMMPVDIEFTAQGVYVASIGDLLAALPSYEKVATISRLPVVDQSITATGVNVVIDDIYRMAGMEVADLNGDGVLDFVVCGFGGRQGNVAWFESQSDGSYLEHALISRPGAVRAQLHDFNGDQNLDIAVLLSDAREGFYILINNGENEFESTMVFETHPSYGHTYFELQDFNSDGLMDILAVNGDNVDSDPYNTLKNFHGIRIYLNRGDLRFEEAYFYPMYGAFGAKAADFDNDGDLDIAAISFFPDFSVERRESFVYLQNEGQLEFSAHTTPELVNGRWMTIGAGDLDGDADVDIVLGGSYIPTGMFAYMDTYRALAESAPSVLVLKNNLN
ncbi:MAG: VCBS repeat-containing protein [Proteobacteria bacterium]|nr:VCBS repeat-containing protein [Pseudomonadota bacterium]